MLYLLGLAVPDNMDGRVLLEAMDPEQTATSPVCYRPGQKDSGDGNRALTTIEEEQVLRRLRDLGYAD